MFLLHQGALDQTFHPQQLVILTWNFFSRPTSVGQRRKTGHSELLRVGERGSRRRRVGRFRREKCGEVFTVPHRPPGLDATDTPKEASPENLKRYVISRWFTMDLGPGRGRKV